MLNLKKKTIFFNTRNQYIFNITVYIHAWFFCSVPVFMLDGIPLICILIRCLLKAFILTYISSSKLLLYHVIIILISSIILICISSSSTLICLIYLFYHFYYTNLYQSSINLEDVDILICLSSDSPASYTSFTFLALSRIVLYPFIIICISSFMLILCINSSYLRL